MTKFLKKVNILYERLILVLLVLILLIAAWCVYDSWYVFEHTADKNMLRYKPTQTTAAVQGERAISDEMAAWLTIDGTDIDFPVMQGTDNIKYLNTDPFGDYSLAGSIYLDSRNKGDFTDPYSLVYGHHMEYGRMFGTLDSFLDSQYLSEHRKGTLMIGRNAEKIYTLQIFAAVRANAKDKAVFDPGKGDIQQYIANNTNIRVDERYRLLALSTCTEGDAVSRIVVFCYIIDE